MQAKDKSQTNKKTKNFVFSKREMFLLSQKVLLSALKQAQQKQATVFALSGDLGSGKTAFCQGLAKALKIKNAVNSPTFVIYKKYATPASKRFKYFYHFDCYRLKSVQEAKDLGMINILRDPANIVAIEWPENIFNLLPSQTIKIFFKFIDKNTREVKVK